MTREEIGLKIKQLNNEVVQLRDKAAYKQQVAYYISELYNKLYDVDMKSLEDTGLDLKKYFEYLIEGELTTSSVNRLVTIYNEQGIFACAEALAELDDLFNRL